MKLQGLKVVDLSVFFPGPYLTLALADHGAEVIKVEPPGVGDPGREIGVADGETSAFFKNLNRGKKSVVLDLKSASGREALLELCETADVFVESFRPASSSGSASTTTPSARAIRPSSIARSAPSARTGPIATARRTIWR